MCWSVCQSGFRRRHKVSQRSVRVLERLPRRERRVSKGFVRRPSSVREAETRVFRIAKKGQVAKKNETADDGGGSVSPRPTARYPSHAQGPRRQLPNQGVAKNGELLGPKVKGQMGYSKANI